MPLVARLLGCVLILFVGLSLGEAFLDLRFDRCGHKRYRSTSTMTTVWISFGSWFGKDGRDNQDNLNSASQISEKGKMGGVANIMSSMEDLQNSQRVGKKTAALVQELSSTTVEGIAQDGKIKIQFDCQQRPLSVHIDDAYFESSDVGDIKFALTTAMQDGHAKSIERMDEKMKSFYQDLGLKK
jgi:DNA-binding protein YbaB